MFKILLIFLYFCISLFASSSFGTIISNAIVINSHIRKYDQKIIKKTHKALLSLAMGRMISDIGKRDKKLVIKFFKQNDPDFVLSREIADNITTVISRTSNFQATSNMQLNMNSFQDFSSQELKSDPVGTIVLLIENIKKFYRQQENLNETEENLPIAPFYNKDKSIEDAVPINAIFAIAYKFSTDLSRDIKFLNITIIYCSTDIKRGEANQKSIILQKFSKKIDISTYDKPGDFAAIIYRPLVQKISNLINDELGK